MCARGAHGRRGQCGVFPHCCSTGRVRRNPRPTSPGMSGKARGTPVRLPTKTSGGVQTPNSVVPRGSGISGKNTLVPLVPCRSSSRRMSWVPPRPFGAAAVWDHTTLPSFPGPAWLPRVHKAPTPTRLIAPTTPFSRLLPGMSGKSRRSMAPHLRPLTFTYV